jgi:hypothetical protein
MFIVRPFGNLPEGTAENHETLSEDSRCLSRKRNSVTPYTRHKRHRLAHFLGGIHSFCSVWYDGSIVAQKPVLQTVRSSISSSNFMYLGMIFE